MFGISLRYGVSLEELLAANPEVQPNFLSIGTLLVIPPSAQPNPEADGTSLPPAPTPVPLESRAVTCSSSKEGGVWCFLLVQNSQSYPVEGITAVFRLTSPDSQTTLVQRAALLLDQLPPGAQMPLAAYFPPPVPGNFQAAAEIETALPGPDDGRYLPVRLDQQKILLAESGLSAAVEMEISLAEAGAAARRIWVVAAAYDQQGNVAGLRRWESEKEAVLEGTQRLPIRFNVYSVSNKIAKVELYAEARP